MAGEEEKKIIVIIPARLYERRLIILGIEKVSS